MFSMWNFIYEKKKKQTNPFFPFEKFLLVPTCSIRASRTGKSRNGSASCSPPCWRYVVWFVIFYDGLFSEKKIMLLQQRKKKKRDILKMKKKGEEG